MNDWRSSAVGSGDYESMKRASLSDLKISEIFGAILEFLFDLDNTKIINEL